MQQLAESPGMGRTRPDLAPTTLRFWRVHSYFIVYSPSSQPLTIVRVLSAHRDLHSLLFNEK
jgi:plasmid stabilization system protein ParE